VFPHEGNHLDDGADWQQGKQPEDDEKTSPVDDRLKRRGQSAEIGFGERIEGREHETERPLVGGKDDRAHDPDQAADAPQSFPAPAQGGHDGHEHDDDERHGCEHDRVTGVKGSLAVELGYQFRGRRGHARREEMGVEGKAHRQENGKKNGRNARRDSRRLPALDATCSFPCIHGFSFLPARMIIARTFRAPRSGVKIHQVRSRAASPATPGEVNAIAARRAFGFEAACLLLARLTCISETTPSAATPTTPH
jgi:hypothetical protein